MNVSSVPNLIELGADLHYDERFASYLGDHCFQVEQELAAEPITCATLLNERHNRAYPPFYSRDPISDSLSFILH